MSEYTDDCRAANIIASRLRGTVYALPKRLSKLGKPLGRPRRGKTDLTAHQQRVLNYMREFLFANDQLPPYSELARHFGWKSLSTSQAFITRLAHKGAIERNQIGGWRFPRDHIREEVAQASDWTTPTSYLLRFGDALQSLCRGRRPTEAMMGAWLDTDDEQLQTFCCDHGPSWAQGIAVIDAARVLADQPTEGPPHEYRND